MKKQSTLHKIGYSHHVFQDKMKLIPIKKKFSSWVENNK
jgi:hypothetical protein